ncbi:hypothetical protein HQ544_02120 [Candidatus Falkowbacteria bacterium]|nr:hypothetical protein [Candidatus Falkowbacteria bacterium]
MKKLFLGAVVFCLATSFFISGLTVVMAQDDANGDSESVEEITEVAAEELDIGEPGRFSWLGNFVRNVQIRVTRDPIKKSELELKKANYEILRLRKIAKEKANDEKIQEKLEQADEKYKKIIANINVRIQEIKANEPESETATRLSKFLDKYTDQQIKHQEILKNVGEKVPEQVRVTIEENRAEHLVKFGEVMNEVQDKEKFKQRLKKAVEKKEEIMQERQERVEERVEDRKEAIIEQHENSVERRANRADILIELQDKIDIPEIRAKVQEIKAERADLFYELKLKREEIKVDWKDFRENVQTEYLEQKDELRGDIEAKNDFKIDVRDVRGKLKQKSEEMRGENQDAREDFRQDTKAEIQEMKPSWGDRIINVFKTRPKPETDVDTGADKTDPSFIPEGGIKDDNTIIPTTDSDKTDDGTTGDDKEGDVPTTDDGVTTDADKTDDGTTDADKTDDGTTDADKTDDGTTDATD